MTPNNNSALAALELTDWPDHWSPWVIQTLDELYEAERASFDFIPESAPNWVHDLLSEVVKVMHPDIKWVPLDQPGESVLGFAAGYFRNVLESENGLPMQLNKLGKISQKLDAELREKWGKRKYDRFMYKNRRFVSGVERFFENQQICYAKKYEALEKCFLRAIKLPVDFRRSVPEPVHFFQRQVPVFKRSDDRASAGSSQIDGQIMFLHRCFVSTQRLNALQSSSIVPCVIGMCPPIG